MSAAADTIEFTAGYLHATWDRAVCKDGRHVVGTMEVPIAAFVERHLTRAGIEINRTNLRAIESHGGFVPKEVWAIANALTDDGAPHDKGPDPAKVLVAAIDAADALRDWVDRLAPGLTLTELTEFDVSMLRTIVRSLDVAVQ